ncbi:MAG: MBL fold metallo-hydrolase [Clostridium sp.]
MIIKTIPAGIYDANCYILIDEATNESVILDPGGDEIRLEGFINSLGVKVKYILLTHGHVDHVGAVEYLSKVYNAPYYIHEQEEEYMKKDNYVFGNLSKANGNLKEGDTLTFGGETIKVIETPGHTKGGVCFLIGDRVFTGDTLFQGSIGRTDFPGGDFDEIINSIRTKLLVLGDSIEVYPGHGPKSTIEFEKRRNPFLH